MRSAALAVLVAAALPAFASAAPVTVIMNGTWDYLDDPDGVVAGQISLGTSYSATLTYDDSAPDFNPAPNEGNYDVGALPFSFTLTTGGLTFAHLAGGFAEIDVIQSTVDTIAADAHGLSGGPGLPAIGFSYFLVSLDDTTATALTSPALVGLPWVLSDWNSSGMALFFDVADGDPYTYVDLGGTVESLVVAPEPASVALVAAGALALAALRRRRV